MKINPKEVIKRWKDAFKKVNGEKTRNVHYEKGYYYIGGKEFGHPLRRSAIEDAIKTLLTRAANKGKEQKPSNNNERKIQIADETTYRSTGFVNQSDDMVKVDLRLPRKIWRRIKKELMEI